MEKRLEGYEPRLFASDTAVRHVGEGLLARTLQRVEWTHEAHLATCAWIILDQTGIAAERDPPAIVRRYNESVGGVNDETQGYHETITQCFILEVRRYLARTPADLPLVVKVNGLLRSPEGK
jgi:hypothetical protein